MPDALDALFKDAPASIGPTQAANLLGVTTRTMYTWLKAGHVPGYQIGTTWIIVTEELKDTVRAGKHIPGRDAPGA